MGFRFRVFGALAVEAGDGTPIDIGAPKRRYSLPMGAIPGRIERAPVPA